MGVLDGSIKHSLGVYEHHGDLYPGLRGLGVYEHHGALYPGFGA